MSFLLLDDFWIRKSIQFYSHLHLKKRPTMILKDGEFLQKDIYQIMVTQVGIFDVDASANYGNF